MFQQVLVLDVSVPRQDVVSALKALPVSQGRWTAGKQFDKSCGSSIHSMLWENKHISSSLRIFFYKSVLFKGNFSFLFMMS